MEGILTEASLILLEVFSMISHNLRATMMQIMVHVFVKVIGMREFFK